MRKKIKNQKSKIKNLVWGSIFILLLLLPGVAAAQSGPTGFEKICSRGVGLAVCVQQIYLFSLGFGALLALLMLILAGYKYMTAQGNASQVESAKEMFTNAFIGAIIIFAAFILLNLINPDLVRFRDPSKTLKLPGIEIPIIPAEVPPKPRTDVAVADEAARLGAQIKASSSIVLDRNGDYPGFDPAKNIDELIAKNYPSVCSPNQGCKPGGDTGTITINPAILSGLLKIAVEGGYSFRITSLTTGKHSAGSMHYSGRAVDIVPSAANRNYWKAVRDFINTKLGGTAMCEDLSEKTDVPDCSSGGVDHIHWDK